jgi:hypothetical protein
MKPVSTAKSYDGVILRQAALIVGFAYLDKDYPRRCNAEYGQLRPVQMPDRCLARITTQQSAHRIRHLIWDICRDSPGFQHS